MSYDSAQDTRQHIVTVRNYIVHVIYELKKRYAEHDVTKLKDPEKALFDEYTPKLKDAEYGSDEYKGFLEGLKPALDHHYATYRHHPEHFENGVADMNLIDVIEMLADWKAATLRTKNGDLGKSIEINADRFGYGDEYKRLLTNTARDLGWFDE